MKHNKTQRRHIRDYRYYTLGIKRAFKNAAELRFIPRLILAVKILKGSRKWKQGK